MKKFDHHLLILSLRELVPYAKSLLESYMTCHNIYTSLFAPRVILVAVQAFIVASPGLLFTLIGSLNVDHYLLILLDKYQFHYSQFSNMINILYH